MQAKRKLTALLLSLCMLLGMLPMTAFAAGVPAAPTNLKLEVTETGLKASWDKPETTGGLDIFEYKVTLYGHFDGIAGEKTEVETKTVQRETTCTFTNTGNAEGVINPNYEVEVKAREGVSGTGDPDNLGNYHVTEWTDWSNASTVSLDWDEKQIVNAVNLVNVSISMEMGLTPAFTAEVDSSDQDKYEVYLEQWSGSDGKSITSEESFNSKIPEDERITTFEEGVTYRYSVWVKAKEGYAISEEASVYLNGRPANKGYITALTVVELFVDPRDQAACKRYAEVINRQIAAAGQGGDFAFDLEDGGGRIGQLAGNMVVQLAHLGQQFAHMARAAA